MRLGAHASIAGGLHHALERAHAVGCETVQLFVKSNRQWAVQPLGDEEIALFHQRQVETGLHPLVGHTSYLLNVASPDPGQWTRSRDMLTIELERCDRLGVGYLVLHPGAHMGAGEGDGLARVVQTLDEIHEAAPGAAAQILLETTSGQGSTLGCQFEQLAWVLAHVRQQERLGVCLDTCHVFAAGYELRTSQGYAATMDAFDRVVGLARLKALHLNDSKGNLGSRLDRHEHIGKGAIGLEGFRLILNDPALAALPGLLETPKGEDMREDRDNLAVLRSLCV
ncbi:MAG: deoxyribonuclease IV [Anaerolineales bacterium]|nr:deoxyribonuclease IV [Anaerolineales bacterium]